MAVGARIDAAVETIGRLCGFPRWPAWLRLSFYRAMQVVALLLIGVCGAAFAAKAFLLAASALTVGLTLSIGASIAIERHRGGRPDRHPVFDRLPRPIQVAWSYAYLIVGRLMLGALTRTPLGAFMALSGASASQEGAAYHRRMRRLRTPRARTLTSVDGRRAVLYLRSFAADEIGTGGFLDAPLTTDEEQIATTVHAVRRMAQDGAEREAGAASHGECGVSHRFLAGLWSARPAMEAAGGESRRHAAVRVHRLLHGRPLLAGVHPLASNWPVGDVGPIVERHIVPGVDEEGYSVEFFDMTGNPVGVATLPATALRMPIPADRPAARALSA